MVQGIDLYVVPSTDDCPAKIGGRGEQKRVPDLTGHSAASSVNILALLGYGRDSINVATKTVDGLDKEHLTGLSVCKQSPTPGAEINTSAIPVLTVSRSAC